MKIRASSAVLLACLAFAAGAQSPAADPVPAAPERPGPSGALAPDDPAPLLDLTLEAAWNRFGPPRSLAAVRGDEPWQDDVAFEYEGGFTIYWYRDRLWQIRLYGGYAGSCFGVFLGDSPEKALSLLGPPERNEGGLLEWRLPFRGYPVRLRLLTLEGAVREAYVYRSDF